jgi:hypothetical protein
VPNDKRVKFVEPPGVVELGFYSLLEERVLEHGGWIQPSEQPSRIGIHDKSGTLESVDQYRVRRFGPDTGQPQKPTSLSLG